MNSVITLVIAVIGSSFAAIWDCDTKYEHKSPISSENAVRCASEGGKCIGPGTVFYGSDLTWTFEEIGDDQLIDCSNEGFGCDPLEAFTKICYIKKKSETVDGKDLAPACNGNDCTGNICGDCNSKHYKCGKKNYFLGYDVDESEGNECEVRCGITKIYEDAKRDFGNIVDIEFNGKGGVDGIMADICTQNGEIRYSVENGGGYTLTVTYKFSDEIGGIINDEIRGIPIGQNAEFIIRNSAIDIVIEAKADLGSIIFKKMYDNAEQLTDLDCHQFKVWGTTLDNDFSNEAGGNKFCGNGYVLVDNMENGICRGSNWDERPPSNKGSQTQTNCSSLCYKENDCTAYNIQMATPAPTKYDACNGNDCNRCNECDSKNLVCGATNYIFGRDIPETEGNECQVRCEIIDQIDQVKHDVQDYPFLVDLFDNEINKLGGVEGIMTDICNDYMTDITTAKPVLELGEECILFYHTNIVSEWSPNGRGCYAMLARNGQCWEDGTICGVGTTCNKCCNEARDDLGTKCGGNKWSDGTYCGIGTTCKFCENGQTYWDSKLFTACGTEPCWQDGLICGIGTTCENCCNKAFTDLGTKCGGNAWADGTICGVGTTCDLCQNGQTYWYSKAINACGNEPKWEDGTTCAIGTTCKACKNEAKYWDSKLFHACGTEPCWEDGSICGIGTTCDNCCNKAFTDSGTKCGGNAWSDGTICGLGTTCNLCQNPATHWPSKGITACGSEPCWGGGTTCGKGTTCNTCCSGNDNVHGPMCWLGICLCG